MRAHPFLSFLVASAALVSLGGLGAATVGGHLPLGPLAGADTDPTDICRSWPRQVRDTVAGVDHLLRLMDGEADEGTDPLTSARARVRELIDHGTHLDVVARGWEAVQRDARVAGIPGLAEEAEHLRERLLVARDDLAAGASEWAAFLDEVEEERDDPTLGGAGMLRMRATLGPRVHVPSRPGSTSSVDRSALMALCPVAAEHADEVQRAVRARDTYGEAVELLDLWIALEEQPASPVDG